MLKVLQGVRPTALFLSSERFCEMLASASYTNISAFLQEQLWISKSTVWIVEINQTAFLCICLLSMAKCYIRNIKAKGDQSITHMMKNSFKSLVLVLYLLARSELLLHIRSWHKK